jgi:hypothetical protein
MIIGSKNNKSNSSSSESINLQIARLAYIGAVITTLGDGVAALAAGLALRELENSSNGNSRGGQSDQAKYRDYTQQQIDYLIDELNQLKKMGF